MRVNRTRIGFVPAILAVAGVALLGGCGPADPGTWQTFVSDLLRNVAAAALL